MRHSAVTILVSMAGKGDRFRTAGYELPKYALEAVGRTLLNWSLCSLRPLFQSGRVLFVFCEADNHDGSIADLISSECSDLGVADYVLIPLSNRTRGQAETAFLGLMEEAPQAPLLIWNIDTYVEPRALIGVGRSPQNAFYCFECFEDRSYSWVRKDESSGHALEVREKEKISQFAGVGLYEFATVELFRDTYLKTYGKGPSQSVRELYVAPLYGTLIDQQIRVDAPLIDASAVHILGTPVEYEDWRETFRIPYV